MVPQPLIEVRCERCQSSFAPGTRRCIHCGGRLAPARVLGAPPPQAPASTVEARPFAGPAPRDATGDDEGAELELPSRTRNLIWVVTAIVAIVGSILGRC